MFGSLRAAVLRLGEESVTPRGLPRKNRSRRGFVIPQCRTSEPAKRLRSGKTHKAENGDEAIRESGANRSLSRHELPDTLDQQLREGSRRSTARDKLQPNIRNLEPGTLNLEPETLNFELALTLRRLSAAPSLARGVGWIV